MESVINLQLDLSWMYTEGICDQVLSKRMGKEFGEEGRRKT